MDIRIWLRVYPRGADPWKAEGVLWFSDCDTDKIPGVDEWVQLGSGYDAASMPIERRWMNAVTGLWNVELYLLLDNPEGHILGGFKAGIYGRKAITWRDDTFGPVEDYLRRACWQRQSDVEAPSVP